MLAAILAVLQDEVEGRDGSLAKWYVLCLSESVGNYADVIFATLHLEERDPRTCCDPYQSGSPVCVTFSCRDAIRI